MSNYSPFPVQSNTQLWWCTALLIAINVGLFAWQIFADVDITQPEIIDAIRWGADYAPLTYLEEPQRLFTSMFFHFGLIHLMLNMWALYIFGSVAEQLFGRSYFIGLYVLAGLMGSLLSGYIDVQNTYSLLNQFEPELLPRVGAGASGAVMGLGAALAILSLLPVLPRQQFILDRKSLLLVMGLNLGMGFMISGINNAAHIGGMLMGILLALLWYLSQRLRVSVIGGMAGLLIGAACCLALYQYNLEQIQQIQPLWQEILSQMKNQLGF